jgi:hypothetical protein
MRTAACCAPCAYVHRLELSSARLLQRCRLPLHLCRRSTTGCSQTIGTYPACFSERAPVAVECLLGPPPVSIASGFASRLYPRVRFYRLSATKGSPCTCLPHMRHGGTSGPGHLPWDFASLPEDVRFITKRPRGSSSPGADFLPHVKPIAPDQRIALYR